MQKIEINSIEGVLTEISIDGHKLENVRGFKIEQRAGNVPILTLDMVAIGISLNQNVVIYDQNTMREMEIVFKDSEQACQSEAGLPD